MAVKYRKVNPFIWNDSVFRALSDDSKLIFLLCMTHQNMTALGAMRATIQGLAAELDWPLDRAGKAFREPFEKGLIVFSSVEQTVWLPKFLKHNPPDNPNVVKGWGKYLDYIPEGSIKNQVIQGVWEFSKGLPQRFIEALPKPFRIHEHEHEHDKENPYSPLKGDVEQPQGKKPLTDSPIETPDSMNLKKLIIEDLNCVLGTSYMTEPIASDINRLLDKRIKDNHHLEHFMRVHRAQYREWKDTEQDYALRPHTLYNGKFTSYLQNPVEPIAPESEAIAKTIYKAMVKMRDGDKFNLDDFIAWWAEIKLMYRPYLTEDSKDDLRKEYDKIIHRGEVNK